MNFNPVACPELSPPAGFHFAVYPDPAIQYEEFCFNTVLGDIGKLQELGEADGIGSDDNSMHSQSIQEMGEKKLPGINPGSMELFAFVVAVSLFGKLQNFDHLGQQLAGLGAFSGSN